jgi:hypothetical protein
MKQKYYTLAEAAHWIAFGTPRPTIEQIISEQNKLQTAAQRLPAALASGTIKVFGQRDFNSDSEQITDLDYVSLDFEENTMTACDIFDYVAIMIDVNDLHKAFPRSVSAQKILAARPSRRIIHDVAFYVYQTHKTLTAKKLAYVLNEVFKLYPEPCHSTTYSTVASWLTGFKNGTYKPINTKIETQRVFSQIYSRVQAEISKLTRT